MIKLKDIIKNQEGLGDTIEKITQSSGIKTLVEKTTEKVGISDCGCQKRKEYLNKKFPYKK